MKDPIDDFLHSDYGHQAPPALKQSILAQTVRVLRRRRFRRRCAGAAALAACFFAGMATMGYWQTRQSTLQEAHQTETKEAPGQQETFKQPAAPVEPPPSLVELEWRAFDSRENRAALFFEVGRRYLDEEQDYESALRCYRQALDAAPTEELAIRPNDTWLVMVLKEARQKEKHDAVINP